MRENLLKAIEAVGIPLPSCKTYGRIVDCLVDSSKLPLYVVKLHDSKTCRLTTCLAYDMRPIDGYYYVAYILDCPFHDTYVVLRTRVTSVTVLDSIGSMLDSPPCIWCEWEIRDLYGLEYRNHPGRGRLVLPDCWPEGVFPLRKDSPELRLEVSEALRRGISTKRGPILPIGPYHPALHEPEMFELIVDGERVVDVKYRGFFVYRGIEKLAEDRFTYYQVPFLAERICGICGFVHSITYCRALEEALHVEVPEEAKILRTFLLELERIHSHLLLVAVVFHTIGFDTGFMHLMSLREAVMDSAELITGNRKTYSMAIPGGVRRLVNPDTLRSIASRVEGVVAKAVKLAKAYLEVNEVRTRLEGVGILSKNDAWSKAALGPTARASGVGVDVRRNHPYEAYSLIDFNVVVRDEGDCMARVVVRLEEALESARMLKQLASQATGKGEARTPIPYTPLRMGMAASEAPRGEVIHFVVTGYCNRLWRWKVRAPSYNNIALLPLMLRGVRLADAPVVISSIDPCFSCTDRLVVIDAHSGRRRIVSFRQAAKGWSP